MDTPQLPQVLVHWNQEIYAKLRLTHVDDLNPLLRHAQVCAAILLCHHGLHALKLDIVANFTEAGIVGWHRGVQAHK